MSPTWSSALAWLALTASLACGPGEVVNGCERGSAVDATGRGEVEIGFGGIHGHAYAPECLRVSVGTRVRFTGPFEVHPLAGGALVDGVPQPDPANPVGEVAGGSEATFAFARPGAWGFFCHYHAGEGMMGAVFVE